jgi:anaerobic ribonucleoside-triphosphate reductase activating protein
MTPPDDERIHLAGFAPASRVNGPGLRVVVWVQGCDLACPGCFNAATHPRRDDGGSPIGEVVARVLAARGPDTAGVTFSGGEPFQQAGAVAAVARGLRAAWPEASLMAFSGYRLEELRAPGAPPGAADLLAALDLIVDGRFEVRRPGNRPWRGSRNQRLWVLGRPPRLETEAAAGAAEIHVTPEGGVLLSGFPDARLRRLVTSLS